MPGSGLPLTPASWSRSGALRPLAPARSLRARRGHVSQAHLFDENRPVQEARSSRISGPSFCGVLGLLPREVSAESGRGEKKAPAFPGRTARVHAANLAAPDASACQRWGSSEDADFDQETIAVRRCRSLPAARPPRFGPGALASTLDLVRCSWALRGTRAPYCECQYYGSSTYKIVSGIDFRFGQNGVFGRIYL